MKKVRIFFSVALVGIAVAAAAATNVKRVDVTYYYQLTSSCPSYTLPDPVCVLDEDVPCGVVIPNQGPTERQLFVARDAENSNICITPLTKVPE